MDVLGKAAREVAASVTNNTSYVWASVGVDYKKCPMNCNFCAFGTKWGIINEENERSFEQVLDVTRNFVSQGAKWIVLRTTQFYEFNKLTELIKLIRTEIPGNYEIVVNTGEFDELNATIFEDSGVQRVYHTLRLREGIDTKFNPKDRIDTLETVKESQLELAYLIEPIGIEHDNEEIADIFLTGLEHGATLTGAMARVPLPKTPLSDFPQISNRRHAQIAAVTRLAANRHAPNICVHPPNQTALNWGANVLVVETGAIPRDVTKCESEWNGFDIKTATKMFNNANYELGAK
ncbi:radical SAM protein [Methanosalsum natronophilum]|nr:radical SAM protein [Methanosalsum natronophilum]MCS3923859.1 biotin synthase [Methanosalsum natronophilum]